MGQVEGEGADALGDVLVARHGQEALVAPREGLRKVLGLHRLMGRSRQRVVAAPHDAGGLGGLAVPHLVVARRQVEWGSKQQGREVELHNREDASRGVSLFHWGSWS